MNSLHLSIKSIHPWKQLLVCSKISLSYEMIVLSFWYLLMVFTYSIYLWYLWYYNIVILFSHYFPKVFSDV